MTGHMTAKGASLYEAMFTAERAWELHLSAHGIYRYSEESSGFNCPALRGLYLAKLEATNAYFAYLAEMRNAA